MKNNYQLLNEADYHLKNYGDQNPLSCLHAVLAMFSANNSRILFLPRTTSETFGHFAILYSLQKQKLVSRSSWLAVQ